MKRIIASLLLAFFSFTFAACDKDQIRKAALAAHRVTISLEAAADTKDSLLTKGIISKDESARVTALLLKAVKATRIFNDKVALYVDANQNVKVAMLTASQRDELTRLFDEIVDSIDQLATQGVVTIGSEKARQQLDAILAAARASIAIIRGVLYAHG